MVQSFNMPGVASFVRLICQRGNRAQLLPHFVVRDISSMNFKELKSLGIKGIIFDKDNTLTHPYVDEIQPSIIEAFNSCKAIYGPRMIIFSNSAGSSDDKGYIEAQRIENALGIHVLRHEEKKPEGLKDILSYFNTTIVKESNEVIYPYELAVVGDRYLTDIVFGNKYNMLTFRCQPFTHKGEKWIVRRVRDLEDYLVRKFKSQGIIPPPHPLLTKYKDGNIIFNLQRKNSC